MQTTRFAPQSTDNSLGFVEFLPTNDIALIEANVDGRLLRLHLEDTQRQPTTFAAPKPQGTARVSVQAQGNRLSISIEFPPSSRLSLPRPEFMPQQPISPASLRATTVMAAPPARPSQAVHEERDSDTSTSESITYTEASQVTSPSTPPTLSQTAPKSEVPLFERAVAHEQRQLAQQEAVEPAREPVARAAGGAAVAAAPEAQPFGAVVQSLTADHEAMAMHRVSEDDARIKGRRQEERIEQAVAKHARPIATGYGIDMAQRKSIDTSRRPSVAAGEPGVGGRDSMQSEKLDDVEYTKDEELERLKGFWHKIFHKKGSKTTGANKHVEKA